MRKLLRFLRRFIWLYILVIFISIVAIVFFSPLFRLQTFLCTYDQRPCPPHIEAELKHYLGKSLLTLRPQRLESKLKAAEYRADKITVTLSLPHTLKVTLTKRAPYLTLGQASNSAQLLIDQNLIPYELEATPTALPKIISLIAANLPLGEPITTGSLKNALTLAQTLEDYFLPYEYILAENSFLSLRLKPNLLALFPLEGNYSTLVTSLQLILRESTIQPPPQLIDLRFSKPILR